MIASELRQVKMPDAFHDELKQIAKSRSIYLRELYDEAIRWFVVHRSRLGSYEQYLTSPRGGAYKSMWLTRQALAQVKSISNVDGVSENRVIYTGFYLYIRTQDSAPGRSASVHVRLPNEKGLTP